MTDAEDWQGRVGTNWARERARTGRSFAGLNAVLAVRVAAFVHVRAVAAPGARLVFSCFRDRAENPWATETAAAAGAAAPVDPHAPGPFAFADRARVAGILSRAGWTDVAFEAVDWNYVAGGGADPVADAVDFFGRIGPAGAAMARMAPDARAGAIAALRRVAERNLHDDVVRFRAAAWIVTATG